MIQRLARSWTVLGVAAAVLFVISAGACRRKAAPAPPVATATLQLSHERAPLGSPLEMTYKFVVANDAKFTEDYRVMVHVVDADNELMFTFDHAPDEPTKQWKPGQTVEYTHTEFIPVYPYVGEATIRLGLYSLQSGKRLPLRGEDLGQREYKAGRIQLQPQTENVFVVFKEGFHPAEAARDNAAIEWQWTKKEGTLTFKNPKKDAMLYLDVDHPGSVFLEPQQVQVSAGATPLDSFALAPNERFLKRIPLKAVSMGDAEMVDVHVAVDKTYIPATMHVANNKDPRELGVRIFHAFVDAR